LSYRPVRGSAGIILSATMALTVAACGSGDEERATDNDVQVVANAPDYCHQLAKLPDGLQIAVSNAAAGQMSGDDKGVIADAAKMLRGGADDKSIPADLRDTLTSAAVLLDKLSMGKSLSDKDAAAFGTTFENLGKAVEEQCA
jgi:hypothetical protein